MGVYVDQERTPYRGRMKMSHMVADTLEELHAMAEKLGLKREWFQVSQNGIPHYDLCESNRLRAVHLGAKLITRRELALFIRRQRKAS